MTSRLPEAVTAPNGMVEPLAERSPREGRRDEVGCVALQCHTGASSDTVALPEGPIRHTLFGGRIGVASRADYLRTLAEAALWLGLAPLPARLLWRLGARGAAARTQRWWAEGVARTLRLRIDMDGLGHVDPREAYVVVPLHEGFADVLALLRLPLRLRFVVRDELAGWRFLGAYLRDTEQIAIRPEDGPRAYRQMVRAAGPVLAAGESLVVFPQGSILGIEVDFMRGAFALAAARGRPVLPVALTGGHRVWEHPFTLRLRRGERISLRVLPPIPASQVRACGAEAARREVQRRLKATALEGTMAWPRRFVPARDGFWDGYAYEIDPAFPALAADIAARRATRKHDRDRLATCAARKACAECR